jgi:DNA polymerase-3 subunit delta'
LVLADGHPDVEFVAPVAVNYRADEVRALVDHAQMMPTLGRWLIIVIEDADRLNEASANALLKALEEPTPHTVWMLCAPSSADVLPTIASRARHLVLRTPDTEHVVDVICARHGVSREVAELASCASQGHIGRARALATDELARQRRAEVLSVPSSLGSLPQCLEAARRLVETAQADADAVCAPLDEADAQALAIAFGDGAEGSGIGTLASRSRSESVRLKRVQESRARRVLRDQFDRVLLDLTGFYRDVLLVQSGADVAAINPDAVAAVTAIAAASTPEQSAARLGVLRDAAARLRTNAAPLLAFEAALVALWRPDIVAA